MIREARDVKTGFKCHHIGLVPLLAFLDHLLPEPRKTHPQRTFKPVRNALDIWTCLGYRFDRSSKLNALLPIVIAHRHRKGSPMPSMFPSLSLNQAASSPFPPLLG